MAKNVYKTCIKKISALLLVFAVVITGAFFTIPAYAETGQKAVKNPHYEFTDMNGNEVSTANPSNETGPAVKYKILIFGRDNCQNTRSTLKSISKSSWVSDNNIEVMFIEEGDSTPDLMQDFVNQYCCSDMIVCPTQNKYGSSIMWNYYRAWEGKTSTVTYPVIFMIDEDDLIRGMTTNIKTASEVLTACKEACDGKAEIDDPVEPTEPDEYAIDISHADIDLETSKYTYNGDPIEPYIDVFVFVEDDEGGGYAYLTEDEDYTVEYRNNTNVGTAEIIIEGKGDCFGTAATTFQIVPKAATIKKPASLKKGFTAKWVRQTTQTSGYQIRYSLYSNMKKAKIVTVKGNKITSKKITKGIKSKKTYYVQIRTYKTISGEIYPSSWSSKTKVKTR